MKRNRGRIVLLILIIGIIPRIGFSSWLIIKTDEVSFTYTTSPARAVAYIKQDFDIIRFTSIKRALEFANNDKADTIYVIPGTNPVIEDGSIIRNKDTLAFPYQNEETGVGYDVKNTGPFADLNSTTVAAKRKNVITLVDDATLIIETGATLIVGGQLGENAQTYISNTTGLYTELQMGANSTIINHGTIDTYGYIKGVEKDNGAMLVSESGAKMYMPFVVYDYRGGTYTSKTHNGTPKIFPFNLFDFPNIQTKMKYKHGSELYARIRIYASKSLQIPTPAKLIGTSDALFLLHENASVTFKYNSANPPYTSNDAKTQVAPNDTKLNEINQTFVTVEGTMTISTLTLSFSGININTTDYYLPFSYKYQFEVLEGSTININSKIKFLKGSSLNLHKGATLNINKETIFHQKFSEINAKGKRSPIFYDEGMEIASQDAFYNAKLINNGTINIKAAFAGRIETTATEEDPAIVNYDSTVFTVVSPEVSTEAKYKNVTGFAYGKIAPTISGEPAFTRFVQDSYTSHFVQREDGSTETWWVGTQGSTSFDETLGNESRISCLSTDTLILMGDNSTKPAGEIRSGDLVKVFNHETGKLDVSPVIFNDDVEKDAEDYNVIYLEFSNGSTVKVIYEHGFFNLDTNKYEYIDESNYLSFIGDRFAVINNDTLTEATLVKAYVKVENIKLCSPVSAFHLNIIAEGMLSMPGGIAGLFNIFEFDENLKYNEEKKAQDIEKYGLFTYEDFKDLIPYDFYAVFPAPYLKVAIGKGLISEEGLLILINRYLDTAMGQLQG